MRACVSCKTWFALSAMNAAFGLSGCFSSSTTWRTAIFFGFVNSGGGWAGAGVGSTFFSSGFFSSGFLGATGGGSTFSGLTGSLTGFFFSASGSSFSALRGSGSLASSGLSGSSFSTSFSSGLSSSSKATSTGAPTPRTWFCTLRAKRWMSKRCSMILAVWSAPPLHNRCTTTAVVIHKKSGMFASRRIADGRPNHDDRPEKS
ncbi:MAG: hypothetical protein WDO74_01190 [Pseudomonadota bacterium]